jgi:choline dehydrogenase-like flavoprotein
VTTEAATYDAIVVGSGISGGWAAKELTEKGLRVLLLERGRNVEHIKDYVNATKAPWQYPHRGGRTKAMEEAYPVLKRDYPLNEKNLAFWASDKDSPYTEVKRFDWFRGYQVGGKSLMWGRQSYRWSDFDFEANLKDGIAIDWPIRYAEIAPWYDHVEKHAGISGSHDKLPQLPDGQFQPAMPLNCGEQAVAARSRDASPTQPRLSPAAAPVSTETPAGSAAPTARTSARNHPLCLLPRRQDA